MRTEVTIADIMRHCNCFFGARYGDVQWVMTGGRPDRWTLPARAFLFWNGSVYRTDDTGTAPEWPDGPVEGRVWELKPPADFLRLCDAIIRWSRTHDRDAAETERVGEYSVRRGDTAWQTVFFRELSPWRRMFPPWEGSVTEDD